MFSNGGIGSETNGHFSENIVFCSLSYPFFPIHVWLVGWLSGLNSMTCSIWYFSCCHQSEREKEPRSGHSLFSPCVFMSIFSLWGQERGPPPPPSLFVSISGVMNMVVVWCTEQYMVENMWARFGPLLFPETRHLFSLAQVYTVSELTVQQQNEKKWFRKNRISQNGGEEYTFYVKYSLI